MSKLDDVHIGLEGLKVYQVARSFRNSMYSLVDRLPDKEKYALASQARRAAISVTNNIAEGYGRFTWQDTTQFFYIARGSVAELIDDLSICLDQKYFPVDVLNALKEQAVVVVQLINGYIRYLQQSKHTQGGRSRRSLPADQSAENRVPSPESQIPNIESQ